MRRWLICDWTDKHNQWCLFTHLNLQRLFKDKQWSLSSTVKLTLSVKTWQSWNHYSKQTPDAGPEEWLTSVVNGPIGRHEMELQSAYGVFESADDRDWNPPRHRGSDMTESKTESMHRPPPKTPPEPPGALCGSVSPSCCCWDKHLSVCDRERLLTHTPHRGTLARQNAISHRDPTSRPSAIIRFLGCKMVTAFKCNWTTWGFEASIFEICHLMSYCHSSKWLVMLLLSVNVYVLSIMNEKPSE